MIEQNNVNAQFDEKDIEQIFGGESVLANSSSDQTETRSIQQEERMKQTVASDNLT